MRLGFLKIRLFRSDSIEFLWMWGWYQKMSGFIFSENNFPPEERVRLVRLVSHGELPWIWLPPAVPKSIYRNRKNIIFPQIFGFDELFRNHPYVFFHWNSRIKISLLGVFPWLKSYAYTVQAILHQIEEGLNCVLTSSKCDFAKLRTPTQNLQMYLDQLSHRIENTHRYQNVRNEIFFHFRYKSSTHAISHLRKIEKTEKKVQRDRVWIL